MQHVQENLTKRSILCPIEHDEINMPKSNIILTRSEQMFLDTFKDLGNATIKRLGNLLDRNIKLIEKIYEITRKKPHTRKSILLFACSVDHAKNISVILNACLKIKSHYVVGEMDRQDRLNAIKQFRSGELEVLCNYGVLTTGYDSPNIDCVIVARPTMSQLLYTQMVGRGLRGKKSGGTENCLVIDIHDDIQQHNNTKKLDFVWAESVGLWKDGDNETSMESPNETISKTMYDESLDKLSHTCPKCGSIANGYFEIAEKFGVTSKRITTPNPHGIQSHCKTCRSTRLNVDKNLDLNEPKKEKYFSINEIKNNRNLFDEHSNRTCSGMCKKHTVKKPSNQGRYESGQCRCQTCDVWLDYHGCHLKDQSPAIPDRNVGWFCNCCNYRVRRRPRNKKYKDLLRRRSE